MKKLLTLSILAAMMGAPVFAATHGHDRGATAKSAGAAALSLFVWPGIGQAMLDNPKEKNITHAVLGLTGIFRFWSAYDSFVDRRGGVWDNRI
ncbi:MAG: hypothetical protein LBK53_06120 [Heliobacteriaceae bacterium]|nr:hypothetical protein [Heliobacteriaceae bacterium]